MKSSTALTARPLVAGLVLLVCGCAALKPAGTSGGTGAAGTGSAGGSTGTAGSTSSGVAGTTSTGAAGTSVVIKPPAPAPKPCVNLQCQQTGCMASTTGTCTVPACPGGADTTVTGTIYDPAGKVPLYNIVVYVPNGPLDPISDGVVAPGGVDAVKCARCDSALSGQPVTATLTDAKGQFTLKNVPVGANIPLVIQIGKWRREVKIPNVTACSTTAFADKTLTRLPRDKSEGHIPKIALTTGGADALECLLRKIGIADSEFTPETGDGRVNFYGGVRGSAGYDPGVNAGALFTAVEPWWDSLDNLKKYDMIIHSCEGTEKPTNKSPAATKALMDYADIGGRVFASHWHNYWFEFGPPPFMSTGVFLHRMDPPDPLIAAIDISFPKGLALSEWLFNVGGSPMGMGTLVINQGKKTLQSVNMPAAQRWIYSTAEDSVQYFTANTPVSAPADQLCGRVVFSDIHVSAPGGFKHGPFPSQCAVVPVDVTPQELALEFMLFDLSSCIQEEKVPPIIP
jgi:hypothetical protein